jgi:hypothetical protein
MSDILQKIQLKREALARQAQALESPELQQKIQDYQYWSTHLPILKKEIEALIGEALDGAGADTASSKRGRKGRAASVVEADLQAKISDLLKGSPDGLAGSKIAEKIHATNWPDRPISTIYQKVTKILNADQELPDGTRKYRKDGQLRNTKWFFVRA